MDDGHAKDVAMVLGLYRGGTSVVAGMLQQLGVDMGPSFSARPNPKGFFEDLELAAVTKRRFYPEPWLQQAVAFDEQVDFLRGWRARRSAASRSAMIGGKIPVLCLMVPQLRAAFGSALRLIAVRRPLDAAVRSLEACRWPNWPPTFVRRGQQRLQDQRDRDLAGDDSVLWLEYHDVLASPATAVRQIVTHLGLTPTAEQFGKAVSFVDPGLSHFG